MLRNAEESYFRYGFEITFPELLEYKTAVVDLQGEMISGPDRKAHNLGELNDIWLRWQRTVSSACKGELFKEVPQYVIDYFQETKHLNVSPREIVHQLKYDISQVPVLVVGENKVKEEPILADKPKFTWSFTAIDTFLLCARKFAARWYYKTEKFVDNPEAEWGRRKHKADEQALKGVVVAEPDIVDQAYVDQFLAAKANGATLYVEDQIALDRNLNRVDWFSPEAWGRAAIDVGLLVGENFFIYDWKNGKEKTDPLQMTVCACFAFIAYPQIKKVEARYIWLKTGKVSNPFVYTRENIITELKTVLAHVADMETAWDAEQFSCKKNYLCKKYCGVTDCVHHGK